MTMHCVFGRVFLQVKIWFQNRRTKWKKSEYGTSDSETKTLHVNEPVNDVSNKAHLDMFGGTSDFKVEPEVQSKVGCVIQTKRGCVEPEILSEVGCAILQSKRCHWENSEEERSNDPHNHVTTMDLKPEILSKMGCAVQLKLGHVKPEVLSEVVHSKPSRWSTAEEERSRDPDDGLLPPDHKSAVDPKPEILSKVSCAAHSKPGHAKPEVLSEVNSAIHKTAVVDLSTSRSLSSKVHLSSPDLPGHVTL